MKKNIKRIIIPLIIIGLVMVLLKTYIIEKAYISLKYNLSISDLSVSETQSRSNGNYRGVTISYKDQKFFYVLWNGIKLEELNNQNASHWQLSNDINHSNQYFFADLPNNQRSMIEGTEIKKLVQRIIDYNKFEMNLGTKDCVDIDFNIPAGLSKDFEGTRYSYKCLNDDNELLTGILDNFVNNYFYSYDYMVSYDHNVHSVYITSPIYLGSISNKDDYLNNKYYGFGVSGENVITLIDLINKHNFELLSQDINDIIVFRFALGEKETANNKKLDLYVPAKLEEMPSEDVLANLRDYFSLEDNYHVYVEDYYSNNKIKTIWVTKF